MRNADTQLVIYLFCLAQSSTKNLRYIQNFCYLTLVSSNIYIHILTLQYEIGCKSWKNNTARIFYLARDNCRTHAR